MTPRLPFRAFLVSRACLAAVVLTISAAPALAATCGTGTFASWLDDFKNEAAAKGISQSAIAAGLSGVTLDKACCRAIARRRSSARASRNSPAAWSRPASPAAPT